MQEKNLEEFLKLLFAYGLSEFIFARGTFDLGVWLIYKKSQWSVELRLVLELEGIWFRGEA